MMAYRYSRPEHEVPEWRVVEGPCRWKHERRGIPGWVLALLVVVLLLLGWAIYSDMEPGAPDDAAPLIMDR